MSFSQRLPFPLAQHGGRPSAARRSLWASDGLTMTWRRASLVKDKHPYLRDLETFTREREGTSEYWPDLHSTLLCYFAERLP